MNKLCNVCSKTFSRKLGEGIARWEKRKFCSQECYKVYQNTLPNRGGTIKKGHKPWNTGKKGTYSLKHAGQFVKGGLPWNKGRKTGVIPRTAFKKSQFTDELHPLWRGNNVGYSGLHYWVSRKLGKPGTCEHCGRTGLKGKNIQWANKSGRYLRDLSDWIRLCARCHSKFDHARAMRTS